MRSFLSCSFELSDIEKDCFINIVQQLCYVTVLVQPQSEVFDYQLITDDVTLTDRSDNYSY